MITWFCRWISEEYFFFVSPSPSYTFRYFWGRIGLRAAVMTGVSKLITALDKSDSFSQGGKKRNFQDVWNCPCSTHHSSDLDSVSSVTSAFRLNAACWRAFSETLITSVLIVTTMRCLPSSWFFPSETLHQLDAALNVKKYGMVLNHSTVSVPHIISR